MKNMPILFVAFSHTLTQSQIDGFFAQYGEGKIVTLREVAPELQAQMSQIPATASISDIQELAKAIVAEAVKAGATHFFMVGEPTLTMWANLYAGMSKWGNRSIHVWSDDPYAGIMPFFIDKPMVCIQSTTERRSVDELQPDGSVKKMAIFSHVMWREMF